MGRVIVSCLACIVCLTFIAYVSAQEELGTSQKPAAWYRADRVVMDDNQLLRVLIDTSRNGRDIIAGEKAPRVVKGVGNGGPVIQFTGAESPLINSAYDRSRRGFTVFVVASFDQVNEKLVLENNRCVSAGQALVSDGGSAGLANGQASPTVPHPFISTQKMNGGTMLQLAAAGDKESFKGDIAEIIIFQSELPEADRATVFSYLLAKYALPEGCKLLPVQRVNVSPSFESDPFWFQDTVTVEMSTPTGGAAIYYTTDGSKPDARSPRYVEPLKLTESTVVKARAFAEHRDASPVTTARFVRIEPIEPTANTLKDGWEFSWGDEFNGPEVDDSVWGYETGYVRNNEAQCYTKRKENSRIDNGHLLIQGRHDNWNGHEWTSASRSTEDKLTLTYGRYEMRAKIDIRSGSWPAWWIWSKPSGGGWSAEGEIDMMEYYTGFNHFNVMDAARKWNVTKRSINSLGGPRWADAFHVWTMEWDAQRIDLYLDGVQMLHYNVDDANGTGPGGSNPFRHPERKKMLFNQALGGTCGGPVKPEFSPYELRVDWMRVHTWSEKPAYTLTVNAGSGTGPYVVGTKVSINANMPPKGYVFDRWVGNIDIDHPQESSTTITMPDSDATLTALYQKKNGAK